MALEVLAVLRSIFQVLIVAAGKETVTETDVGTEFWMRTEMGIVFAAAGKKTEIVIEPGIVIASALVVAVLMNL